MDMDADDGWRRQAILYPAMLIAAISVIIFSMIGIAAMTGLLPSTVAGYRVSGEAGSPAVNQESQEAVPAPSTAAAVRKPAVAACGDCGIVESIRSLQRQVEGTMPSAVGVPGAQIDGGSGGRTAATSGDARPGVVADNEMERNKSMNTSVTYQVRVRMSDGAHRNVYQATEPRVAVGQRVRVSDGQLRAE